MALPTIYRVSSKEVDREKWDSIVKASNWGNIFSMSWYLDSVAPHWEALISEDYKFMMPIVTSKKIGISTWYQPFFTRETIIHAPSDKERLEFIQYTVALFDIVHIGLPVKLGTFPQKKRKYQLVDLKLGPSYSNNVKRILKKAGDVEVTPEDDPLVVVEGFKNTKGSIVQELGHGDYVALAKLMDEAMKRGAKCWSVRSSQGVHAAGFYMVHQDRVTYLKGFSDEVARENGYMHVIMDYAINYFRGEYTYFDFGGSDVDGVATFYKKFGANDAFYVFLNIDQSPWYYRLVKKLKFGK